MKVGQFVLGSYGLHIVSYMDRDSFVTRPSTFFEKIKYLVKNGNWPRPLTFSSFGEISPILVLNKEMVEQYENVLGPKGETK